MTNEQIEAMTDWTLENFQADPLGAVRQARELAAAYLALQAERDAAVADIALTAVSPEHCPACIHNDADYGDKKSPCWTCTRGNCHFEWRGKEQARADG